MSNLPAVPPSPETVVVKGVSASSTPASATKNKRGCSPGCLTCGLIFGITGLVAVTVIIVAILIGGTSTINAVFGGLRGLVAPPAVAVVGEAPTSVIDLAPLSQLVTISTQLARADVPVQVSGGALNACGYSAYHVVMATLAAGVDLSQVTQDDIVYDEATGRYTVTVPAPQYTSCSVDYSRQYERSFTTCNVDWDAARQLAEYTSLQAMMQETFEGGLLDRAGDEAQNVLSSFIGALTGKPVDVVFDASRQPPFPAQCERRVPDGWTYDAVSNQWRK
ncbi:MAG: DUF4230 domain-containing protein [Anaerolineae bacterium]